MSCHRRRGGTVTCPGTYVEHGKPVALPLGESEPQGEPMGLRVEDVGESECLVVMTGIRIGGTMLPKLSGPKGSRLPTGVQLRDNL